MRNQPVVLFLLLLGTACTTEAPSDPDAAAELDLSVPAWAKDVVWYQIFVERFRNGDPSNDPTLHDMEGIHHGAIEGNLLPAVIMTEEMENRIAQNTFVRGAGKDVTGEYEHFEMVDARGEVIRKTGQTPCLKLNRQKAHGLPGDAAAPWRNAACVPLWAPSGQPPKPCPENPASVVWSISARARPAAVPVPDRPRRPTQSERGLRAQAPC